jgi:hypothetical protein
LPRRVHLPSEQPPAGERQRIDNPGPDELVFLALCTPRFQRAAYQD